MAKREKGPKVKHVRMAAQARRERNNWLYGLLVALLVGIAFWALVSFTPLNDHTMLGSGIIFGVSFFLVLGIGIVGMKYSRMNTEYNRIKNEYGITDQAVKELMKREG